MAKIQVIIPAYNAEKFLADCIDSVINQTFTDWNLTIVNDGSSDSTMEICERYTYLDRRVKLINKINGGTNSARNKGLNTVDPLTEYIIFLDSDDSLESDALEILLKATEANPQAAAAYGLAQYIDVHNKIIRGNKYDSISQFRWGIKNNRAVAFDPGEDTTFNALVIHCCITTPGTVLMRRKALELAGYFDPSFSIAGDWDLWLRLSALSAFIFVNKIVLNYRRHDNNISKNVSIMVQEDEKVYRKLLSSKELTVEQHQLLRTGYKWRYWYKSNYFLIWAKESFNEKRFWQAIKQMRHFILLRIKFFRTKA